MIYSAEGRVHKAYRVEQCPQEHVFDKSRGAIPVALWCGGAQA